ncbi:hypothetical protein KCV03_g384, partial [Aureobasidium melanogenum]
MRRLPCRALSKLQSKYFHLWLRRRWCLQRTPFDHHQAASCYELAIATLSVVVQWSAHPIRIGRSQVRLLPTVIFFLAPSCDTLRHHFFRA